MAELESYSEKIEFSAHGIRLAVLEQGGQVVHHDNWTLEMFGGALPNVGDYITTLWDPEKPDPAESYRVLERHWIGELMGDNCWWLLLEPSAPTAAHRDLFIVARNQSAETRHLRGDSTHSDLVQLRLAMEKKIAAEMPAKRARRRSKPR